MKQEENKEIQQQDLEPSSLLILQSLIYYQTYYTLIYWGVEIIVFIWKGNSLKYPPQAYSTEIVFLILWIFLQYARLYFGYQGNKTENSYPLLWSFALSVPTLLMVFYFMFQQVYVLVIEYDLGIIMLIFIFLELLFGIFACLKFVGTVKLKSLKFSRRQKQMAQNPAQQVAKLKPEKSLLVTDLNKVLKQFKVNKKVLEVSYLEGIIQIVKNPKSYEQTLKKNKNLMDLISQNEGLKTILQNPPYQEENAYRQYINFFDSSKDQQQIINPQNDQQQQGEGLIQLGQDEQLVQNQFPQNQDQFNNPDEMQDQQQAWQNNQQFNQEDQYQQNPQLRNSQNQYDRRRYPDQQQQQQFQQSRNFQNDEQNQEEFQDPNEAQYQQNYPQQSRGNRQRGNPIRGRRRRGY